MSARPLCCDFCPLDAPTWAGVGCPVDECPYVGHGDWEGPGLSRLDADGGALEDGEETRQHG